MAGRARGPADDGRVEDKQSGPEASQSACLASEPAQVRDGDFTSAWAASGGASGLRLSSVTAFRPQTRHLSRSFIRPSKLCCS